MDLVQLFTIVIPLQTCLQAAVRLVSEFPETGEHFVSDIVELVSNATGKIL